MKYKLNAFVNQKTNQRIPAVKGDSGREIHCTIADADMSEITGAKLYATKPSGLRCFLPCSIQNDTVIFKMTNQLLAEHGVVCSQICLFINEDIVSTLTIYIDVNRSERDDSAIESTNEFSALQTAMSKIDKIDIATAEEFNTYMGW